MRIKRDISVFFSTAFIFLIVFSHTSVAQNLEFASDLTVSDAEVSFSEDNEYLILTVEITNLGNVVNYENIPVSVEIPSDGWPNTEFNFFGVGAGKSTVKEFQFGIPEEKRGEWINIIVNIDPENSIAEFNEDNNEKQISEIFIPEKMPDLVINSVDAQVSEDENSVILNVNIANEGDLGSDDFLVTAKGPDLIWTASEIRVEEGLDGGETRTIELILGIPEEYPEGMNSFEVEVDRERKSGDVNYENNKFLTQVLFPEKKPDLVINRADAWVSEDEGSIIYEVEYSNEGNAPANEFSITVGSPEEEWAETKEEIITLGSGVSETAEGSIDIPEEQRGRTLAFSAEIDPDNEIDELDEQNNLALTSEVFIPQAGKPELTISSVNAWISEDRDSIIISAEIANEGDTSADSFLLSAGNPEERWDDTQIAISGLEPGGSTTIERAMEIPDEQREKELALRVIVDPENKIEEADEENNIKWTTETFIPAVQAQSEVTETLGETPSISEVPDETPLMAEVPDESPLAPQDGFDNETPWGAIVTITLTVTVGGLLTANHNFKIRRHRKWENRAVEETPEECDPHTEFCLKIRPEPRKITRLSLHAYDSVSGNKIKKDVRGEIVDDLNRAFMKYYRKEKSEVQRDIEAASSKLLEEIKNWLSKEKFNFNVSIFMHLEGSKVTCQYARYLCERKDKPEEKWKKTFKDAPEKEVGTLSKLDPFEPTMPEKLHPELTRMLVKSLENICKMP